MCIFDAGDAVNLPEVELVGLHIPQGPFQMFANQFRILGHGLGHEENAVPVFRDKVLAVKSFAQLVCSVSVRGIEEADTSGDGFLDSRFLLILWQSTEVVPAEAKQGDAFTGPSKGAGRKELTEFV